MIVPFFIPYVNEWHISCVIIELKNHNVDVMQAIKLAKGALGLPFYV